MKTVYILTREGRSYTDEGCDHIRNMIEEDYHDESPLKFAMGSVYNDGVYLKELLEERPDSYVAVSTACNIFIVSDENIRDLAEHLCKEETSWEMAVGMYDATFGTDILESARDYPK